MEFDFKKSMQAVTDDELVTILTVHRQNYQPEAILAAEEELQARKIPEDKKQSYTAVAEQNHALSVKKINEPLELHWKVLTLFFPMMIAFILSGFYKSNGFDRKAKELAHWTLLGFGCYIVLFMFFFSLGNFAVR